MKTKLAQTYIDVFRAAGSPASLRSNVVRTPVWPAETLEHHFESLRDLMDNRALYEELDKTPREILNLKTLLRLKTIVSYAYTHIPFYRDLYKRSGFEVGDLKTLKDFNLLPSIKKHDLKLVYDQVSKSPQAKINFKARTSGSTGIPLSLINDTDRQKHWFVKRMLMFENMMGQRLSPSDWIYSIYYEPFFLTSILGDYRTFTVGLNASSQKCAEHIRKLKPKIVTGVASQIINLAKELPDAKELGILAFTTNSESSSSYERLSIGKKLSVPILDEYSSEELGIIAWELRDGAYVVSEDTIHLELKPNKSHGMCEVIGTDLWNFTMPRIRYEQGDFAEWKAEEPAIGLKRIKRVIGRQDMKLISPDFGPIDPSKILSIFDTTLALETSGIAEFRLVQKSKNTLELLVGLSIV